MSDMLSAKLRQDLIEKQYGMDWTQLDGVRCMETIL